MRKFIASALRVESGVVRLLDQTRLPHEEIWLDAGPPEAMVRSIRALKVRGAPLIGVAAAASLAWQAEQGASDETLRDSAGRLRAARPTAVNLMAAMDRMLGALDQGRDALIAEAEALFDEDVALCEAIAAQGAPLIQDGEGLLTHCNTGSIATAGVGTALGVIRRAWESGKKLHVYVDETRPLLQGGRLTAWELRRLGVPCTLITDSMAALILRDGRASRVLVGADRVAANGDFANKVGTYGLAALARFHGAEFHAVLPRSTVDLGCPDGATIPIEQRDPDEVRGASGAFGSVRWAPEEVDVYNPAFDVTPAALLTSMVLDCGVLTAEQLAEGGLARALGAR